MDKVYAVAVPDAIRGVYCTWAACKTALGRERTGYRHQQWVDSCETAMALLRGPGIVLAPGAYAFTDGNRTGGVGVALVRQEARGCSAREFGMFVTDVFRDRRIPNLDSDPAVLSALGELEHGLTEIAAPYFALREVEPGTALTIVYDRVEVEELFEHQREPRSSAVAAVVQECDRIRNSGGLRVSFKRKSSHQSELLGRDDLAYWNNRADQLADRGAEGPSGQERDVAWAPCEERHLESWWFNSTSTVIPECWRLQDGELVRVDRTLGCSGDAAGGPASNW
jgi:hypothetical protein